MKVPLTIGDFLERAETVYPDGLAVVDEPGTPGSLGRITYREMAARARGMALALDRMGVPAGARVALVSPNASRFMISYFGVSGYGRVLVPVNYRLSADEVSYIVEHSGSTVVLVDPEIDEALSAVTAKERIVLDGADDAELFAPAPDGALPAAWAPDEDATCTINYTSGTTARPKGVQLTHRSCWLNATSFGWHASQRPGRAAAHPADVPRQRLGHAVRGHRDGRRPRRDQEDRRRGDPAPGGARGGDADVRRPGRGGVDPRCGGRPRGRGGADPGRDRVRIIVAGAPPPSAIIERVEEQLGWEFIQIYGLTETSPLLTVNRARSDWDDKPADERARLLVAGGRPRGRRAGRDRRRRRGARPLQPRLRRLLAAARGVGGGAARRLVPHRRRRAPRRRDSSSITDRKKDVIITGGENVSSIEVEDCLYQHPAVAEAAVIGVPDEKWGETIKALVVLRPGTSAEPAELIEFCRARMTHYKCPTTVEVREALERTATGKLQKFKLRAPYWQDREREVN